MSPILEQRNCREGFPYSGSNPKPSDKTIHLHQTKKRLEALFAIKALRNPRGCLGIGKITPTIQEGVNFVMTWPIFCTSNAHEQESNLSKMRDKRRSEDWIPSYTENGTCASYSSALAPQSWHYGRISLSAALQSEIYGASATVMLTAGVMIPTGSMVLPRFLSVAREHGERNTSLTSSARLTGLSVI